jgi:hypothetical protein
MGTAMGPWGDGPGQPNGTIHELRITPPMVLGMAMTAMLRLSFHTRLVFIVFS